MPFLQKDPNDPENAPSTSGGGAAYVGGEGSGQGATTTSANPTPTHSGNYTNLLSYLAANANSGATTGKAAGNVVNQSGTASTAANGTLAANGAKEVKAGTATTDPKVLAAIKAGTGSGDKGNSTYSGPNATAAAYHGPSAATGVTGYNDAAEKMETLGGNLHNASSGQTGVSALLKSAYQQPNYTAGENSLDAFLAGGTAGGQKAIGDSVSAWKPQGAAYGKVLDAIGGQIKDAQGQTGKVQTDYTAAMNKAKTNTTKNNTAWTVAHPPPDVAKPDFSGGYGETGIRPIPPAPPPALPKPIPVGQVAVDTSGQSDGVMVANDADAVTPLDGGGAHPYMPGQIALELAHGGKVPSYPKLMQKIRGK